jgi:hypothetical protein
MGQGSESLISQVRAQDDDALLGPESDQSEDPAA